MLETLEQNKKRWLAAILIVEILAILFIIMGYFYFKREKIDKITTQENIEQDIELDVELGRQSCFANLDLAERKECLAKFAFIEQEKEQKEKCLANFDLNELDIIKPIWDSELPAMLKGLLVLQAVDQKNRELCDYNRTEIDPSLRRERCEEDYDFFFILTEKLKNGINSEQYIKECRESLMPYILIQHIKEDMNTINQAIELECAIWYQSFQSKAPVIIEPEKTCDKDPGTHDSVDYFDSQTKQIKSCPTEIADKIKFLVAVANNDSTECSNIKKLRSSQYCNYYFNKDLASFYNEFKEAYCYAVVYKTGDNSGQ